jgi:hypothetical protein
VITGHHISAAERGELADFDDEETREGYATERYNRLYSERYTWLRAQGMHPDEAKEKAEWYADRYQYDEDY